MKQSPDTLTRNYCGKRAGYLIVMLSILHSGCNKNRQAHEADYAKYRKEVTQYGITWTFDKPARTGQFITGDWWVQGSGGRGTTGSGYLTQNPAAKGETSE